MNAHITYREMAYRVIKGRMNRYRAARSINLSQFADDARGKSKLLMKKEAIAARRKK